jgi:hypothetical protein
MIVQRWCACGAGVAGEADEYQVVARWTAEHPRHCTQGLVADKPITVSYGCPTCAHRAYGRTPAEAVEQLDLHQCTQTESGRIT